MTTIPPGLSTRFISLSVFQKYLSCSSVELQRTASKLLSGKQSIWLEFPFTILKSLYSCGPSKSIPTFEVAPSSAFMQSRLKSDGIAPISSTEPRIGLSEQMHSNSWYTRGCIESATLTFFEGAPLRIRVVPQGE